VTQGLGAPGVRLLATQCLGAGWAVDADSVERILMRSDWREQPPVDVADTLALRPLPGALERVLVVHGISGEVALLSKGSLKLIELSASDVQAVPNIVYAGAAAPVRNVVLEAAGFPVLIIDLESLKARG
jgi:hypothetical protein